MGEIFLKGDFRAHNSALNEIKHQPYSLLVRKFCTTSISREGETIFALNSKKNITRAIIEKQEEDSGRK